MHSIFIPKKAIPIIHSIVVNIATPKIEDVKKVFEEILGFEIIYNKTDSEYVMHCPKLSNHLFLHFTNDNGCGQMLSKEHLIIFYLDDGRQYSSICEKLIKGGMEQEAPSNPYWSEKGSCFVITNDIRIIICPDSYQHYRARIAAPATNLENMENLLKSFGLYKFDSFQNHRNFDGVMLGSQLLLDCHLEFTHYQDVTDHHLLEKYSITLITGESQENTSIRMKNEDHIFEVCSVSNSVAWIQACAKRLFDNGTVNNIHILNNKFV